MLVLIAPFVNTARSDCFSCRTKAVLKRSGKEVCGGGGRERFAHAGTTPLFVSAARREGEKSARNQAREGGKKATSSSAKAVTVATISKIVTQDASEKEPGRGASLHLSLGSSKECNQGANIRHEPHCAPPNGPHDCGGYRHGRPRCRLPL